MYRERRDAVSRVIIPVLPETAERYAEVGNFVVVSSFPSGALASSLNRAWPEFRERANWLAKGLKMRQPGINSTHSRGARLRAVSTSGDVERCMFLAAVMRAHDTCR